MTIHTEKIVLHAGDGHALTAYVARPEGPASAGLVVLHEIFGVNAHIREVCDRYAARGFCVVAPALFDRAQVGAELGYDEQAVRRGRELRSAIDLESTLLDVQAAIEFARTAGAVAVVGYCWGGTLAFLAATRLHGLASAISYYGAQTTPFAGETIRVPVLMHFGEHDPRIPVSDIDLIRRHNPGIEMHTFPADHGFNCDHRKEWHAESAQRALELTLAFIDRHVGTARSE
jgi:carboxymethylenebutenolidase